MNTNNVIAYPSPTDTVTFISHKTNDFTACQRSTAMVLNEFILYIHILLYPATISLRVIY